MLASHLTLSLTPLIQRNVNIRGTRRARLRTGAVYNLQWMARSMQLQCKPEELRARRHSEFRLYWHYRLNIDHGDR